MNNNNSKRVLPIRFSRLYVGSKFTIFAEPSRNIRKSNDPTIYVKKAESWSCAVDDEDKVAILYEEDLVVPQSRGNQQGV